MSDGVEEHLPVGERDIDDDGGRIGEEGAAEGAAEGPGVVGGEVREGMRSGEGGEGGKLDEEESVFLGKER